MGVDGETDEVGSTDAERSRKRGTEGALGGMYEFSIDSGVQWASGEADGKTTSRSDIG